MTSGELAQPPQLIHATCVAFPASTSDDADLDIPDHWAAILIAGPSGVGKSSLGLRLIALGARLVSDDQTLLSPTPSLESPTSLVATAPAPISGLIEARGVGLLRLPPLPAARVAWVAELSSRDAPPGPRLPDRRTRRFFGVDLPILALQNTSRAAAILTALATGATLIDPDAARPAAHTEQNGVEHE